MVRKHVSKLTGLLFVIVIAAAAAALGCGDDDCLSAGENCACNGDDCLSCCSGMSCTQSAGSNYHTCK